MCAPRGWRGERGATAIFVAVVITVLIGMLALALNAGHLLSVRGETQNAVDSAAMAGALQLNGAQIGIDDAEVAARNFALSHNTDGDPAETVAADEIEFGHWQLGARRFDPISTRDPASLQRINAVRVHSTMPETVWMATFLGREPGRTPVAAEAIAVSGGVSAIQCTGLPFVLRRGCVADKCTRPRTDPPYSGGHYWVALSTDNTDTAGTTNLLDQSNVSTTLICEILQNQDYCADHRGDPLGQGDRIETANGAQWGANCGADGDEDPMDDGKICEIIQKHAGTTATIPVVQFDGEPLSQCDGKWVHSAEIRGFATVKISLVQCKKSGAVVAPGLTPEQIAPLLGPCEADKQAQVCLVLEHLCNVSDPNTDSPGGEFFGTSTVMPRLTH